MLAVAWVQDFANDTETAPKSFTTVLGALANDSVRRPAIHQEPYRALDNGFSEWHSTDIGSVPYFSNKLDSMIAQLRRLPRQVVCGRTSLESSLSAMGEIEERLAHAEGVQQRLLIIKKAALDELGALGSVKQVDVAKAR